MDTIGKIIQRLRNDINLDQDELSLLCGWPNKGRLGKYESDIKEVTVDDAIILSSVLGVSPSTFFSPTIGHTVFIPYKCTSVPVVGEVEAGKVQIMDYVLTTQGSIGDIDGENTNFYPIYGLKVNDNNLTPHFSNGEVMVVDARSYPANGDMVIVKNRNCEYKIELFIENRYNHFKSINNKENHNILKSNQVLGVVSLGDGKISYCP
ncbi:S24 family peptidase [Enterobacter soli]|uniref:S24 family peptidase n=1 Tax=Enterobacter soli TaxID=885040 RepID=UPI003EDAC87D